MGLGLGEVGMGGRWRQKGKVLVRELPKIVSKRRVQLARQGSSKGRGRARTSLVGVKEEWGVDRTELVMKLRLSA